MAGTTNTTTREVADDEGGTTWTLAQAFSGLGGAGGGGDPDRALDAARVKDAPGLVHVVATPSGGARSVRLALPVGWGESLSDADLLAAVRDATADAAR